MKLLIALILLPFIASSQMQVDSLVVVSNSGQVLRFVQPTTYVAASQTDSIITRNTATKKKGLLPQSTFALAGHNHTGVYQPAGNYLVAADIAGKQNTITTGTTAQYFKGDLSLGTYTGYAINVQALTSSPTDAQTVYFGTLPKAPVTAAATSKIYVRQAGTIKRVEIYCYSGTAGSNETWSLYVRVNNTTDYLISSVSASTNERVFSNTNLSIPISIGDYVEIKSVNPTWSVNPLTCILGGYIYIE